MFTGLVQKKGLVVSLDEFDQGKRLEVQTEEDFLINLKRGASISVNGVCLTVTNFKERRVSFDVIQETLRVTNLSVVELGEAVNLERSLKFGDEIGGHILSGHISCTCEAQKLLKEGQTELKVTVPEDVTRYIFDKGYIALNGVSLTVSNLDINSFSVFLIPETLNTTNLGVDKKNFLLNLELDQNTVSLVNSKD